jgi:hypothetical protein
MAVRDAADMGATISLLPDRTRSPQGLGGNIDQCVRVPQPGSPALDTIGPGDRTPCGSRNVSAPAEGLARCELSAYEKPPLRVERERGERIPGHMADECTPGFLQPRGAALRGGPH